MPPKQPKEHITRSKGKPVPSTSVPDAQDPALPQPDAIGPQRKSTRQVSPERKNDPYPPAGETFPKIKPHRMAAAWPNSTPLAQKTYVKPKDSKPKVKNKNARPAKLPVQWQPAPPRELFDPHMNLHVTVTQPGECKTKISLRRAGAAEEPLFPDYYPASLSHSEPAAPDHHLETESVPDVSAPEIAAFPWDSYLLSHSDPSVCDPIVQTENTPDTGIDPEPMHDVNDSHHHTTAIRFEADAWLPGYTPDDLLAPPPPVQEDRWDQLLTHTDDAPKTGLEAVYATTTHQPDLLSLFF